MTTTPHELANVRYIVGDVAAAIDFYTTHLGFTLQTDAMPAFADVIRGPLRVLLSGPASSGARATPDDFTSAGRNRIHLIVTDVVLEACASNCDGGRKLADGVAALDGRDGPLMPAEFLAATVNV